MRRILLLTCFIALKTAGISQEQFQTTVHESVPLQTGISIPQVRWDWKVDVDRDGVIELPIWSPGRVVTVFRGGGLAPLGSNENLFRQLDFGRPFRKALLQGGAVLNRGGNINGVAEGFVTRDLGNPFDRSYFLSFFDLDSMEFSKKLRLPASGPGIFPALESVEEMLSLGDTDGDGYDELLVVFWPGLHPYLPVALVDGESLELRWLRYFPTSLFRRMGLVDVSGRSWEDTNGDGVGDIMLAIGEDGPADSWTAMRVSGDTGEVLWESSTYSSFGHNPSRIGDVDLDGVADLFFYDSTYSAYRDKGAFWVLSGADGGLIWRRSVSEYDRLFSTIPPAWGGSIYLPGAPGPDLNGDGVDEIVVCIRNENNPNKLGFYLFYLDGADGSRLLWEKVDLTFRGGWAPGEATGLFEIVGDVDNDGWPEILAGSSGPNASYSAVFFGHESLKAPTNCTEGESISLSMHLPSAGGKPYRLLLSTVFDPQHNGLHLGDWNTHLGDSLLLGASLQSPSLRGTLSPGGKATHRLRIPLGAGLAGKTLHAIAVVEDATRPGGVWCKSTVASVEILP